MPVFSLKSIVIKSKQRAKNHSYCNKVNSRVTGVLVLTEEGEYAVKYENILYPITKQSFSIKNKNKIFVFSGISPTNVILIYLPENNTVEYNYPYMVFAPAYHVIGDIIEDIAKNKYFEVKKVLEFIDFNEKDKFIANKENLINKYNECHKPSEGE